MSMYYSHLLVPHDANLVFDGASMTAFLEAAAMAGFVGQDPERFVSTYSKSEGGFYWGMSRELPKTGRTRGSNPATWLRPDSDKELAAALEQPANVQATVWSEFRPRQTPLLEVEALHDGQSLKMTDEQFDDVYYVAITCHRTQVPVSMSDDGHGEGGPIEVGFGEPVDLTGLAPFAVAESPSLLRRIEIDGIPAARSWVSITFGNYVFPPDHLFHDHVSREQGIAIVVPEFLALAERLLGCRFRQTCAWG